MRLRIAGQLSQTEAGVNTNHKAVKLEVHTKSQTGIKATQTTVSKGIGTQLCITAGGPALKTMPKPLPASTRAVAIKGTSR